MAGGVSKLPPTEGILQKEGGGTSLFGSKAFHPRYVRIEDGILRYWKKKEDAISGMPSQKKQAIVLANFYLEPEVTPDKDGYWVFQIGAKETVTGLKRKVYKFRVHLKGDWEGWLAVFRANGCAEKGSTYKADDIARRALEAATPPEIVNIIKSGGTPDGRSGDAAPKAGSDDAAAKKKAEEEAAAKKKKADEEAAAAAAAKKKAEEEAAAKKKKAEEEAAEAAKKKAEEEAAAAAAAEAAAAESAAAEEETPAAEEETPAAEEAATEEAAPEAEEDDNPVNAQWTAYEDEEGDVYYVNNESGESQWDKPEGFTKAAIPHDPDE